MLQRAENLIDKVLGELKHHADPANHKPVHIAPVQGPLARAGMVALGSFGLIMIPVAAAVPLLPIWPFALVMMVAMARSSSRFRAWLSANRAFHTVMSLIRTRPERIFQLANRFMTWVLGAKDDAHNRYAA